LWQRQSTLLFFTQPPNGENKTQMKDPKNETTTAKDPKNEKATAVRSAIVVRC